VLISKLSPLAVLVFAAVIIKAESANHYTVDYSYDPTAIITVALGDAGSAGRIRCCSSIAFHH
jgi:hypothetical protein